MKGRLDHRKRIFHEHVGEIETGVSQNFVVLKKFTLKLSDAQYANLPKDIHGYIRCEGAHSIKNFTRLIKNENGDMIIEKPFLIDNLDRNSSKINLTATISDSNGVLVAHMETLPVSIDWQQDSEERSSLDRNYFITLQNRELSGLLYVIKVDDSGHGVTIEADPKIYPDLKRRINSKNFSEYYIIFQEAMFEAATYYLLENDFEGIYNRIWNAICSNSIGDPDSRRQSFLNDNPGFDEIRTEAADWARKILESKDFINLFNNMFQEQNARGHNE